MSVTHQEFILHSRDGDILRCDIRYRANGKAKPVVLFLHGFKGFKDWGPFAMIRERLAEAGFVAIGFNFSRCGIGDDLHTFTQLEAFAENTVSRDLNEVEDMLQFLIAKEAIPIEACEIDSNRIVLFGHSRGASTALLSATRASEVKAIIAWAPVSTFQRYTRRQQDVWREQGFFEIENARTGQILRLNVSLLDDIETHRDRLDIIAHAQHLGQLQKPLLIVAAREDMTAPMKESQQIADAYGANAQLAVIAHTGHTFGAEEPFTHTTPMLEEAIKETTEFIIRVIA